MELSSDMRNSVRSVHRAAGILLYLMSDVEARSFTEIRARVGLSKSTASRILATLEETGLVQRSAETGKYRLGLVALRMGTVAGNQIELRRSLRPFLVELTECTDETSNLGVLVDGKPSFVDNVESPHHLRTYSRIGRQASPYCTSLGKSLLAHLPPEGLNAILRRVPFERRTDRSITSKTKLLVELERVRRLGYAVDDEESERGARCVGAPVFDHEKHVVAAISVSGPSSRISGDDLRRMGQIVRDVAARASAGMGFVPASRRNRPGCLRHRVADHGT